MINVNDNFRLLPKTYLFSEVGARISKYKELHPDAEVIRMDIGDVTRPLFPCVVSAFEQAIGEMSVKETFRGYGPEQGYEFLRKAISENDYKERGIDVESDEIFISDGAKSDIGNLGEIFSKDCKVALMNPAYPAYFDDNVIDGRAGICEGGRYSNIVYLECSPENGFLPELPRERVDLIYLCFPNNPTGVSIKRDELRLWVDYARENGSLIIYDSAYEAFVREEGHVKSIYEIVGARDVAIEVRSFSKTAGFTGVRCGYTVVPKTLFGKYSNGGKVSLHSLWLRRQTTKFNGVSYITQRGAAALYSREGAQSILESTDYYLRNANLIKDSLSELGFKVFGGSNSPYIWASLDGCPDSWKLFDILLHRCRLSVTPGIGFGSLGTGYIRLTGFNSAENTAKAMARIKKEF